MSIKNRNFGASCGAADYGLELGTLPFGFTFQGESFVSLEPGVTGVIPVALTGSLDAEPGVHDIPFQVFDFFTSESFGGSFVYELLEPTGCFVRPSRELMITTPSVVDDPVRTTFDDLENPASGAWTFGRLMRDMAPSEAEAPAFVRRMFETWLTNQTINGFNVPARTLIGPRLLDPWP